MESNSVTMSPISLFYSYSHRDEAFRQDLEAHLSFLRRGKLIAEWHDRKIDAGDEWKAQIDHYIGTADIVLLLVSADFIASDYCWGEEMTKALARHERGEARVIPVILRPCRWTSTPLARLQAVPKDAKAVSEWSSRDAAFDDIATAIERTVQELRERRRRATKQSRTEAEEAALVAAEEARKTKPELGGAAATEAFSVLRNGTWLRVEAVARDLPAGTVFRDGDDCPEMVVIPAGEFMMGSPDSEEGRSRDEGPQHKVTVARPFALGRYALTVAEFGRFVAANGYKTEAEQNPSEGIRVWDGSKWVWSNGKSWRDPGFAQAENHPVVGVSWNDVVAYVKWLSEKTGEPYRLPSEAEWEYAARAGTTTRYPWGDDPGKNRANFFNSGSQWSGKQTAPVASFEPNAFGLYDMIGNVWEWLQDCWNDSYKGAPTEGSAWESGNCGLRVVRGGSWNIRPGYARVANRNRDAPTDRYIYQGFRLARML